MKIKQILIFCILLGVLSLLLFSEKSRNLIKHYYYLIDSKDGLIYTRTFFREKIDKGTLSKENSKILIFLTYGQSNAANASNFKYKTTHHVYEFWNENLYEYIEPSLGASGNGGSVWGLVGDKLIEADIADKVVFMNAAVAGASMEELAYKEFGFSTDLINRYKKIKEELKTVDAILIHQGESNINDSSGYENAFNSLKSELLSISSAPIILANASYCNGVSDDKLKKIQDTVISKNKEVYRGPNSDKILSNFRYDDCHFNKEGLESLSDFWVDSILNSLDIER